MKSQSNLWSRARRTFWTRAAELSVGLTCAAAKQKPLMLTRRVSKYRQKSPLPAGSVFWLTCWHGDTESSFYLSAAPWEKHIISNSNSLKESPGLSTAGLAPCDVTKCTDFAPMPKTSSWSSAPARAEQSSVFSGSEVVFFCWWVAVKILHLSVEMIKR